MHPEILCIGDPHIRVSNLQDVELFITRLEERVLTGRNFNRIVVLGDTLHDHERLHTTALNKAIEFFTRLARYAPVWVLVGNHDMIGNQQFLNENHWLVALKSLPNITIVDTVVYDETINAAFMPYVPNGRMLEALASNSGMELDSLSAIFAHQEIFGCTMGAFISEHGDQWELGNPPVISGHIHSNQHPQVNVYYPGSMLQHAFGESSRNVVAIVTVPYEINHLEVVVNGQLYEHSYDDTSYVSVEEIDLELPRKITLYTDAENFESIVPQIPEDAFHTRVVVEGTADEFKALRRKKIFKTLKSRGAKIVFKSRVLELTDSSIQKTTDDFVVVLQELCDTELLRRLCDEILQQTLQEQ